MTRPITVLAPGKMMLAGEYSVLHPQGLALAVAIDATIEVKLMPHPKWQIERPELGIRWTEDLAEKPSDALHFMYHALLESRADSTSAKLLARDTHTLGSGAEKRGIGGSASISVATCAALALHRNENSTLDLNNVFREAIAAHSRAQNKEGSGYDIATIVHGGLVHFHQGNPPTIETSSFPENLHIICAYSGQPASTQRFLEKFNNRKKDSAEKMNRQLAQLSAPVKRLSRILISSENKDEKLLFEIVSSAHRRVLEWDNAHGFGIFTPEILALLTSAHKAGVAAKIAGAGGGDSVYAISNDPQKLAQLETHWKDMGFLVYVPSLTNRGVFASVS